MADKKSDRSAKPTPLDKETAETLTRLWNEYRRQNLSASGKPPTQAVLAEATGYTQSAISQYLNGYLKFGYGAVLKFARFFGVSPSEIRPDLDALPDAPGQDTGLLIARLENDIDALQFALGAVLTVMARHRPAEAEELAAQLAKVPAKFQDRGLVPALQQALGQKAPAKKAAGRAAA
ncbi:helix-turn-helix domain-containing protein [Pseudoxanthomonas koreensis]|uniref:helix-turn-helix domain-containing protein n=1 Tax=Pseudoxanthomonas koreensis TaxID=266061 RepID=UPI00139140F7|nr:helix-turn-helix transcriptional regulator [Pseudoxanthomonas koreensis]KAF1692682.1 hypothetical protein CSC64_06760 [Pseudoxanthomonas koreensis]